MKKKNNPAQNSNQTSISIDNEQILNTMMDGFILADIEGQLIRVNPAYCTMVGYSEAELLKMNIRELEVMIPPEQVKGRIEKIIKQGSDRFETEHKHKDGHQINLDVSIIMMQSNGIAMVAAFLKDITERKQAVSTIVRFSKLIEESLNEVYIFNAETYKFIEVNQAALKNIGYTIEEIKTLTPLDIKPDYNLKSFNKLVKPLRKNKAKKIEFYTNHKRKDGTLYPVEVHLQLTDLNNTEAFTAIILDITERKKSEDLLRLSEEQLSVIFNNTNDQQLLLSVEPEEIFRIINVNNSNIEVCKQLGFNVTKEDFIGKTIEDILCGLYGFSKEMLDNNLKFFKQAVESGKPVCYEESVVVKNVEFYNEISIVPVFDKNNTCLYTLYSAHNITQQIQANKELQKSAEKYRELINGMKETIWVIDFDGNFIDVNHAAVEKLKYSREELLSMGPKDIDSNFKTGNIKNLIKNMQKDQVQVFETKHRTKDGKEIPVEIQSTLVTYQQKDAILSIARDITDRIWIEKTLYSTQMHYTDFLNASSDPVSYWRMPHGLNTAFPVEKQIEMIHQAVCFDANRACWESFGFKSKEMLIGKKYCDMLVGKKPDGSFAKFIFNGYRIDNLENHEIHPDGSEYFILENWYGVIENGMLTHLWESSKNITNLKQAEKGLIEEKQLIDTLMDHTTDNIYFKDRESRFLKVNKNMVKHLDLDTPDQIVGKSDFDFFDKVHAELAYNDEKNIIQTSIPILDKTEKEVFSDGSINWVSTSKLPYKDIQGKIIGTFGISRDITDRIKSEEEIRRLSEIVEQAEAPVFLTDLNGTIEYVNPAFERVTGFSKKEAIGQNPRILKSGLMSAEYHESVWKTILNGEQISDIVINKKKNGDIWYYDQTIIPLKDENGKIIQFVSTGKDITDRILAENALKESENRLSLALKAAKIGIWDWDVKNNMLSGDNTVYNLYGISENDFCGAYEDWVKSVHPNDIDRVEKKIQAALYDKKDFATEFRVVWPDGTIHYIKAIGDTHRFKNGKPERMIAVNMDITEAKKAEHEIRKFSEGLEERVKERTTELEKARIAALSLMQDAELQKERAEAALKDFAQSQEKLKIAKETAEAATRAKSNFLASMSHELRTPLNSIIGFSQVLHEQYFGKLNKKQLEHVMDILESGEHLLSLINDILDLSKVEAGKMELELNAIQIYSLLENSLIMIKEKCQKHEIQLSLKAESKLDDLVITADERKIKQVMFNLLSNAAKFTPDGGTIMVSCTVLDSIISINVEDTGIGINKDMLVKIFNEFYQVSNKISGKTPGTGLGLPLSRKMIKMHGGHLWAESDGEGKGSRFIFTLPIEQESELTHKEEHNNE